MKKTIGITTGVVALGIGAVLILASPESPAQTPSPSTLPVASTVSVTSYQLISERRISRTVSDFTYRLTVRNTGPDLIVVTGAVTSTSSATTFPDGTASFGDVASSTPANSTDTITLRQDRTVPFSTSQLRWTFRAAPGEGIPPDPGPANDLTVAGIDSDNDGVRDDIERWISATHPTSALTRELLFQNARAKQVSITSGAQSVAGALSAAATVDQAIACGWHVYGEAFSDLNRALRSQVLNTEPRLLAYGRAGESLAGQTTSVTTSPAARRAACAFDPGAFAN